VKVRDVGELRCIGVISHDEWSCLTTEQQDALVLELYEENKHGAGVAVDWPKEYVH